MKKILVISSSFRKGGNSDTLADSFIKGAQEAGHIVNKIFLNDFAINYCKGCGICQETHHCIIKDDVEKILEKMVIADVLVFATPVYFYSMNGQMKTFIDRTVARYQEIKNKEVYFILSAADESQKMMKRVLEGFRGYTQDCLENTIEKKVIYGLGVYEKGAVRQTKAYLEAYETGKAV